MAASVKMAVFWVVGSCSLVETCRRFRGADCLHHQGDVATRRNIPEDNHLHTCRHEDLKSRLETQHTKQSCNVTPVHYPLFWMNISSCVRDGPMTHDLLLLPATLQQNPRYTCSNVSPSLVDCYKYTHWWPASRGTGWEGKRQRIGRLSPPLPFPSSIPFLLWRRSGSQIFCVQCTVVREDREVVYCIHTDNTTSM
jgi:hypothetical protein